MNRRMEAMLVALRSEFLPFSGVSVLSVIRGPTSGVAWLSSEAFLAKALFCSLRAAMPRLCDQLPIVDREPSTLRRPSGNLLVEPRSSDTLVLDRFDCCTGDMLNLLLSWSDDICLRLGVFGCVTGSFVKCLGIVDARMSAAAPREFEEGTEETNVSLPSPSSISEPHWMVSKRGSCTSG